MPREVEKDHSVAIFQPQIHRGAVVTVDDPGFALQQFLYLLRPVVFWRIDPSGFPVVSIEMDDR